MNSSGSKWTSSSQGEPHVPTLKQATSIIPIVFPIAPDPVGTGMITSLARPGGNVTGLSAQTPDLAGKRLELLREVIPTIRRFGVLANAGFPAAALEMREVATAARTLGLEVSAHEIRRQEDFAPAFHAIKGSADALYVCSDPLVNTNRARIYTLALAAAPRPPSPRSERRPRQPRGSRDAPAAQARPPWRKYSRRACKSCP